MTDEGIVVSLADAFRGHYTAKKQFIDLERERNGWRFTFKQAQARVDQWLDPDDPHQFPASALANAMRALGHADFLEPLHATEAVVLRERRVAERAREEAELLAEREQAMHKVQPDRERVERVA